MRHRDTASVSESDITGAVIALATANEPEAWRSLLDNAIQLVDEYLTSGKEYSVFNEEVYRDRFNSDLNALLKWEKLGQPNETPLLSHLIGDYQRMLDRGTPKPREIICAVLQASE